MRPYKTYKPITFFQKSPKKAPSKKEQVNTAEKNARKFEPTAGYQNIIILKYDLKY